MRKYSFLLFIIFLGASLMSGCDSAEELLLSPTPTVTEVPLPNYDSTLVDSFVSIVDNTYLGIRCDQLRAAEYADACFALFETVKRELDSSCETSGIFSKNNSGELSYELTSEEAALVRLGLTYSHMTDGAFDITSEPLRLLWDLSPEYYELPTEELVSIALSLIDYENITLGGTLLSLGQSGMMLNTADLIEGYALDRILAVTKDYDINSGSVRIGNLTHHLGQSSLPIALSIPDGEASRTIAEVTLTDYTVGAFHIFDMYYESDGALYHPYADLHTGYPSDRGFSSVFVFGATPSLVQAAGHACFSLSFEEGNAMLSNLPDVYALYVMNDGSIRYSDGLEQCGNLDDFTVFSTQ